MKAFTLGEITALVEGELVGDPSLVVSSFAPIQEAQRGMLSFIASPKYEHFLASTSASAVLVSRYLVAPEGLSVALIRVDDPYVSLARLMQLVAKELEEVRSGVDATACVDTSVEVSSSCYIGAGAVIEQGVTLGKGVQIYPLCYVGRGCSIGDNTILYPRVTLYDGVEIGEGCIIHAGAVLGADGFGFAPSANGYEKIPQLGGVKLGNYVEIGANTTIDRSVMGLTSIGSGTKIDNLVQVGHNCTIGEHTVISGHVGISGSTTIGSWCRIAGQVGFAGHQKIGDRCEIGAQAGVVGDLPEGSQVIGSPTMPIRKGLRALAHIEKLPEMMSEIRALKKELNRLREENATTNLK